MYSYIFLGLGIIALLLFLFKRDKNGSILAIILKTIASIFFVITSFTSLYYVSNQSGKFKLFYLLLLCLGLIFGMLGDIFLDFKIYFKTLNMRYLAFEGDHDALMIAGMTSFGIGHIFYISSAYLLNKTNVSYLLWSLLIGAVLITIIMLLSIKVLKMNFRKFLIPSIVYGFLLGSFVVFSIFNYVNKSTTGNLILLIGSIMFIISDLILSMTYFSKEEDYKKEGILNPESKFMISINHITYYAAQFLIAISIMFL